MRFLRRAFLLGVAVLSSAAGSCMRSRPSPTHPSARQSIGALKLDCDRGGWPACEMLATCYSVGDCFGNGPPEVYVDRRLSVSYVARACDLGHLDACAWMGAIHLTGHGLVRDLRAAFEIFETTCERGSSVGCEELGNAYENGWGTEIDLDKARAAYGKQCVMDGTACQGIKEPCSINTLGCEARDEVRMRPAADYRWLTGHTRTCPLHGIPLKEDRVPIVHGMGSSFERGVDEDEGAPLANTYIPEGCMSTVGEPKAGLVYYCPECRRRLDALAWHPPSEPSAPAPGR
jgi:hypothetical protein